jgi:hypothetical protein
MDILILRRVEIRDNGDLVTAVFKPSSDKVKPYIKSPVMTNISPRRYSLVNISGNSINQISVFSNRHIIELCRPSVILCFSFRHIIQRLYICRQHRFNIKAIKSAEYSVSNRRSDHRWSRSNWRRRSKGRNRRADGVGYQTAV